MICDKVTGEVFFCYTVFPWLLSRQHSCGSPWVKREFKISMNSLIMHHMVRSIVDTENKLGAKWKHTDTHGKRGENTQMPRENRYAAATEQCPPPEKSTVLMLVQLTELKRL